MTLPLWNTGGVTSNFMPVVHDECESTPGAATSRYAPLVEALLDKPAMLVAVTVVVTLEPGSVNHSLLPV